VLRQHQRWAIDAIVARCADGERKRGLIWHTQGSGKTFTLLTAARLILEEKARFRNATVILVVDRTELEGQLKGWVERLLGEMKALDIATERADSKAKLQSLLDADFRGLIVAMIHKFMSGADGTLATLTIDMPPHDAVISLVATNEKAASEAAVVHIGWLGAKDWYKPDLYVLAIGVAKYHDKSLDLLYPDKDAEDFVKVMQAQQGGLYKQVYIYPHDLRNDHATRDDIRKGLNWLKKSTTSRDIAVLFLSGHGQSDAGGHYRYLPYDTDLSDLDYSTIQDYEIEDFLEKVPGKVIAFLDTCFAGGLQTKGPTQPDVDRLANELASAEKGVVVFTSSTGRQFSLENRKWNNGAFTKALVEAFKGGADFEHERTISIAGLELFLAHRVKELTDGEQSPTPAKPKTIQDFVIATVVP
jgi:hypothetical protein